MDCQLIFDQATQYHREGKLQEAEDAYRQVIDGDPSFADAWNGLGVLAQQMGMYDVSVDLIGQAIDLRGAVPDYYFNLASSYHGLGQQDLEEKALLATLELAPQRVDARCHLGNFYHHHGKFQQAVQAYQEALFDAHEDMQIRMNLANCYLEMSDARNAELESTAVLQREPNHRAAIMLLSRALLNQCRYSEAVSLLQKLVKVDDGFDVAFRLACAWKESGDFALACEQLENLVALNSADVALYANLGSCYYQLGKFDQATAAYQQALALKSHPDYYSMLGVIAQKETHWDEAKDYYRKALALDPNHDVVLNNFGNLSMLLLDFDGAFEYYRRAIAINPGSTDYHLNLGVAYYESNQFDKAIEQYRWVLAHRNAGEAKSAHNNLAMALLVTQAFAEGWEEHNYRPAKIEILTQHPEVHFSYVLPKDLTDKRVLLWAEQGIGDELFFMRFIPLLKQRGARVLCQATSKIIPLVKQFSCIDEVLERSERPVADYEVFLGDLPMLFQCNDAQAMPPPLPLKAGDEQVAKARALLAKAGPPPYIGLTWRGGTSLRRQKFLVGATAAHREIDLQPFADGMQPLRGTLVALQRLPEEGEIKQLSALLGRPVLDCSAWNDDMDEMLALLQALDQYISVPNTNLYLRSALGKETQVMLNARAGWSWLAGTLESFWYPHARLYRASIHDDWTQVLGDISKAVNR